MSDKNPLNRTTELVNTVFANPAGEALLDLWAEDYCEALFPNKHPCDPLLLAATAGVSDFIHEIRRELRRAHKHYNPDD